MFDEDLYKTKSELIKNTYLYYLEINYDNLKKMILHMKNLELLTNFKVDLYENQKGINITYHRDSIICCGGYDGKDRLNTCTIVNLESKKLDYSTKLNEKRRACALVSCCNYIFCIGGYHDKILTVCEYLDTSQNSSWKLGKPLNVADSCITTIFVDPNFIYTFGGGFHNSIERLNISSLDNKWEKLDMANLSKRSWG